MGLSLYALESMGFRRIAEGEHIVASFYSVYVYEVQGFTVDDNPILQFRGQVSGTGYEIALGTSMNKLTQALALSDDQFTDDEQAWATANKCTPPYILIQIGPSTQLTCASGHIKEEGSKLVTYDCFSSARDELRATEAKVLPSLVSALTCRFSSIDHPVHFRRVDKVLFGITTTNRILHDTRFEVKASLSVSKRLPTDEVQAGIESTAALAERLNPKVARFFQLALEENDPLKRFLYFFLSIEIETHATFASIDHSIHLAVMLKSQSRIHKTQTRFFEAQREKWTALKDRFVWCALCVWTHLSDSDIKEFASLKKIRDDIAHGSIAVPPAESVAAAQRLATRLQWPKS